MFILGRGVAGFGPVVIGATAAADSFDTVIALLALHVILDIVALLPGLVPERCGAEPAYRDRRSETGRRFLRMVVPFELPVEP